MLQSWRGKAFPHRAMLFIKTYRNTVACLSGQSTFRSSIMISAMPKGLLFGRVCSCSTLLFFSFDVWSKQLMVFVIPLPAFFHLFLLTCGYRSFRGERKKSTDSRRRLLLNILQIFFFFLNGQSDVLFILLWDIRFYSITLIENVAYLVFFF